MLALRPGRRAGVLALVITGVVLGTIPQESIAADAPSPVSTAGAADPLAAPQPPDGKWLRDADGNEYFGLKVPQPAGSYQWANPEKTRALTRHGIEVEVLDHDDQILTIKIYRTDDDEQVPVARRTPSAADLERVARTYEPDAKPGPGVELTPIAEGLPQRGQWRNGFAVADMDGDGKLDIAFGPARKSRRPPVIFRGDGTGKWTVWQEARFPSLPFDYGDAAAGDLNGDGKIDLVLASHLRGIVAMLGDGKGGFSEWSRGIEFSLPGKDDAPPAFTSRAIELADWNRDGRLDVIALGEGPQLRMGGQRTGVEGGSRGITIYTSGGDGSWTKRTQRGSGSFGNTLAVGDVNGDGLLDVVAGSERRGFRGILNLGRPDGSWQEVEIPEFRPDALLRAVAVADLDGDRRNDLAVGYVNGELGVDRRGIDVLLQRDGGWERRTLLAEEGRDGINAIASGDLDGDGKLDLVALDETGAVLVFQGDGKGGFARQPLAAPASAEPCAGYGLTTAKVTGGSADEIVASFADESDEVLASGPKCRSQGSLRAWRAVRR